MPDRELRPFDVINACRHIEAMPDGTPIRPELAHTLLVLASYWPRIWPGQHKLAADLKIGRRMVCYRLKDLDEAGLITRTKRSGGRQSSLYGIRLGVVRQCAIGRTVNVQRIAQEQQEEQTADGGSGFDLDDYL